MSAENFVLINPEGEFVRSSYTGGGFSPEKNHNTLTPVKELDQATLFGPHDKNKHLITKAIERGYIALPAYSVRKVFLGDHKPS